MSGRSWLGVLGVVIAGAIAGCGGAENTGPAGPGTAGASGSARRVHLLGFDSSEPVVEALSRGTVEGIVIQNPLKMGELGVKTLVQHLEKQAVERRISTGEVMVTPENMNDPEMKDFVHPPKAENASANLSGAKTKKWRVMVIPKGT